MRLHPTLRVAYLGVAPHGRSGRTESPQWISESCLSLIWAWCGRPGTFAWGMQDAYHTRRARRQWPRGVHPPEHMQDAAMQCTAMYSAHISPRRTEGAPPVTTSSSASTIGVLPGSCDLKRERRAGQSAWPCEATHTTRTMSRELISSEKFPTKPHNCEFAERGLSMSSRVHSLRLVPSQALPSRYLVWCSSLARQQRAKSNKRQERHCRTSRKYLSFREVHSKKSSSTTCTSRI